MTIQLILTGKRTMRRFVMLFAFGFAACQSTPIEDSQMPPEPFSAAVRALIDSDYFEVKNLGEYVLVRREVAAPSLDDLLVRRVKEAVAKDKLQLQPRCIDQLRRMNDSGQLNTLALPPNSNVQLAGAEDPVAVYRREGSWVRVYPGAVGIISFSAPVFCGDHAIVLASTTKRVPEGFLLYGAQSVVVLRRAEDGWRAVALRVIDVT